jgi:hypothetical protein
MSSDLTLRDLQSFDLKSDTFLLRPEKFVPQQIVGGGRFCILVIKGKILLLDPGYNKSMLKNNEHIYISALSEKSDLCRETVFFVGQSQRCSGLLLHLDVLILQS